MHIPADHASAAHLTWGVRMSKGQGYRSGTLVKPTAAHCSRRRNTGIPWPSAPINPSSQMLIPPDHEGTVTSPCFDVSLLFIRP